MNDLEIIKKLEICLARNFPVTLKKLKIIIEKGYETFTR